MNLRTPSARSFLPVIQVDAVPSPVRRRNSEWLSFAVSLVVHLVMLGAMAVVVLETTGQSAIDHIDALFAGDGADAMDLEAPPAELKLPLDATQPARDEPQEHALVSEVEQTAESALQLSLNLAADSTEAEAEEKESSDHTADNSPQDEQGESAEEKSSGTRGSKVTSGRTGENKAQLLRRFGGTAQTEAAVQLGLKWLAKQQARDGSWSFAGPYSDPASFNENKVSATSMALLAFLGAGQTQQEGEYQSQVEAGLRWLVARQRSSGSFGANTPPHHALYTHAQATIAICEAYGMTEERWLKSYCQSAVEFVVKSQGPQGGWRYEFKGESDTSVTGWCVLALVSGKSAGLAIPQRTAMRITAFLDSVGQEYGEIYSYMPGRPGTPSMTAEGLLCRMYLGWPRTNAAIDRGAERLLLIAPFQIQSRSYYYWYYATQVFHHVGGEPWEQWNEGMRVQLPAAQVKLGPEAGSWPPGGRMFDQMGGRLYSTCMAIYCLEVYYRHLPIYESPWEQAAADAGE